MVASPSLRRRRLAGELRNLRDESGMSITDVADKLGWQASRISRIETRQLGITAPDLRKLLDLYEVEDEAHRARLADLARRASERGWWQSYGPHVIQPSYADLISVEAEAVSIRTYQPETVPGLLQTSSYAREIIRNMRPMDATAAIERRVEVRLERQQILTRTEPPPPRLQAVLNEAVIRRRIGGSEVMREQIEHLMDSRQLANVTIQVLPFGAGAHRAMSGSFVMLSFLDPGDLGMVYAESATGALFVETPEDLRKYEEIWDDIVGKAYSPDDTRAFLRTYTLRYQ